MFGATRRTLGTVYGNENGVAGGAQHRAGDAEFLGGADRVRTGDPLLAKQVLSQLSYSPTTKMVGLGRVELPTSPLSGVRSSQLSYRPGMTEPGFSALRITTVKEIRGQG